MRFMRPSPRGSRIPPVQEGVGRFEILRMVRATGRQGLGALLSGLQGAGWFYWLIFPWRSCARFALEPSPEIFSEAQRENAPRLSNPPIRQEILWVAKDLNGRFKAEPWKARSNQSSRGGVESRHASASPVRDSGRKTDYGSQHAGLSGNSYQQAGVAPGPREASRIPVERRESDLDRVVP